MPSLHPRSLSSIGYGSDDAGLICAFRFEADGHGVAVEARAAFAALSGGPADAFYWLHFNLANNAADRSMRGGLALPELFYDTIAEGARTTRVEYADEWLIGVLNDALFDVAEAVPDTSTRWLCLDQRVLVSARRKPLRSVDRLRHAVKEGERFVSTVALLVHLLRDQADVLAGILRDATTRIDGVEDSLLADRLDTRRADLGAMRRALVRLGRLFAPEPAALFRLLNRPPVWMAEADATDVRESTEEFAAALADMASLLERIKLLQEEIAARVSEQNNRSLFLLTIFTVLALPINIIAGLFGMNVGGIPLARDDHGFWVIVGIVATLTLVGVWTVFRRRPR
jgi:zinc transporter